MSLPTSGALPGLALRDIQMHTDEFFQNAWWAQELLKMIDDPTYRSPTADQGDMTMMMMVISQMQGFKEQWHETPLSNKEVIYAVGQLLACNKAVREQAERAMSAMIDRTRLAHETGTTPSIE